MPSATIGRCLFDAILCRHLLWTLPDPQAALRHWAGLLRPGGRLILIEGRWAGTGGSYPSGGLPWMGGIAADQLLQALEPLAGQADVDPLDDPALWGRPIHDERYAVIAFPTPQ